MSNYIALLFLQVYADVITYTCYILDAGLANVEMIVNKTRELCSEHCNYVLDQHRYKSCVRTSAGAVVAKFRFRIYDWDWHLKGYYTSCIPSDAKSEQTKSVIPGADAMAPCNYAIPGKHIIIVTNIQEIWHANGLLWKRYDFVL